MKTLYNDTDGETKDEWDYYDSLKPEMRAELRNISVVSDIFRACRLKNLDPKKYKLFLDKLNSDEI